MCDIRIELKTNGNSPQQMAYALGEYFHEKQGDIEMAIIDLEELGKHILTSVEADKQRLEMITKRGGRQ